MAIRKDKVRNKVKVIKEVLKDPLASQDEIAKRSWVSKGTVNNNIQELDQSWLTSETIDRICENDKDLIDLVAWLNLKEIKAIADKWKVSLMDLKAINDITEKSTKRYTLFKWNITDDEWWLKALWEDEAEMLEKIQNM